MLAAIVINAVMGFINIPAMQRIRRICHDSFRLACLATVGVLVLGILPGLLIAIVISMLVLLGKLSRPQVTVFGVGNDSASIVVFRPDSPLLAINTSWIRDDISRQVSALEPGSSPVVLDLLESADFDISGIDFIASMRTDMHDAGRTLWLANVQQAAREMLARSELAEMLDSGVVFDSVDHARDAWVARG